MGHLELDTGKQESSLRTYGYVAIVVFITLAFGLFLAVVFEFTVDPSSQNVNYSEFRSPDGQFTLLGRKLVSYDGNYFTGIQYATARRFQRPEIIDLLPKVNGTVWPKECLSFYYQDGEENCLHLNVYRCGNIHDNYLPVLVYVPEGEPETEDTANLEPNLVIRNLACRGMVVVSVHYRQGAFGHFFLDNPLFVPNLAVEDVKTALQWIRKNIHHFHGNPLNVTVIGQRQGARIVSELSRTQLKNELFSQAILVSGAADQPKLFPNTHSFLTKQSAHLSSFANCTADDPDLSTMGKRRITKSLKCIRKMRKMVAARHGGRVKDTWMRWPIESLKMGIDTPLNIMMGTCGSVMARGKAGATEEQLRKHLEPISDFSRSDSPQAFVEEYISRFNSSGLGVGKALQVAKMDFTEIGPQLLEAHRIASANRNSSERVYLFRVETNSTRDEFEFELKPIAKQFAPCLGHYLFKPNTAEPMIGHFMIDSVVNFVQKGSPNSDSSTLKWSSFNPIDGEHDVLTLSTSGVLVETEPFAQIAPFWLCEIGKLGNMSSFC